MTMETRLITFPDQQAIIDHINNHPLKSFLTHAKINETFPNGDAVQKVAAQFASKTMKREEVQTNIKTAMRNASNLMKGWLDQMDSCIQSGAENPNLKANMNTFAFGMYKMAEPAFQIFSLYLLDLVDGATYTKDPDGTFKRHVVQLT